MRLSPWGWYVGAVGLLLLGQVVFWGAPTAGSAYRAPDVLGAILICVTTLPLIKADRYVFAALVVSSAALLGYQFQNFAPSPADFATLALVVWLVATGRPKISAITTLLLTLAVAAVAVRANSLHPGHSVDIAAVVSDAIVIPIAAAIGMVLQGNRARAQLVQRTLELETIQVRMEVDWAKAAERFRIARDHAAHLLDEAGHSVRDAMAELHRMVGLLREEDRHVTALPASTAVPKRAAHADPDPVRQTFPAVDRRVNRSAVVPTPSAEEDVEEVIRNFTSSQLDIVLETNESWEHLPSHLAAPVLAIVSEGLANVVRHASAHRAVVRLHLGDTAVSIEVEDDGVGASPAAKLGFGLAGVMERTHAAGGRVVFENVQAGGVRLRATLPLAVAVAT